MANGVTGSRYELDLGEPSDELLERAKAEIGEDPDTRCEVISRFRDTIYQRGQCTPCRDDDAFLLRFLRARNFIIPRAHRLLVNYCDFRETHPELFYDFKLKDVMRIADYDIINVPTNHDQNGRRIIIFKIAHWDSNKVTVTELLQANIAIIQAGIVEQSMQICGVIVIFDFDGLTMQHAFQMNPSNAKKFIQVSVTSLPARVMEAHVVNQPWIFRFVFKFLKPFVNEQMKNNIFFHGRDMHSLHRHIDPKYLPKTYGGTREYESCVGWMEYFKTNEVIGSELRSLDYNLEGFVDDNSQCNGETGTDTEK